MRIVGGEFRGRTLVAPEGHAVRPTSERVREAVFNILAHSRDGLEGARVIDLFAGTGAMGLEAVSRGAEFTLFVEDGAGARAAIRRNIEALGLVGRTRIFRRDATGLGPIQSALEPFTLAFLDPPYEKGLAPLALASLAAGGWLAKGARIVVEMREGEPFDPPADYRLTDKRGYGETVIRFLEFG